LDCYSDVNDYRVSFIVIQHYVIGENTIVETFSALKEQAQKKRCQQYKIIHITDLA